MMNDELGKLSNFQIKMPHKYTFVFMRHFYMCEALLIFY